MKKRLTALLLTAILLLSLAPAVFASDLMEDGRFYAKQDRSRTCTLSAAAMMLRRRAYLDGDADWTSVTESDVRSRAWSNGLAHSFSYHGISVGYSTISGSTEDKEAALISLLAEHPEGIVIYDRSQPHAILLTDYTDGVFYSADPAGGTAFGRVPISYASISISGVSGYWYVTADSNEQLDTAKVDTLTFLGLFYPENVAVGSSFNLGGILKSPVGTSLTTVDAAILDAEGSVVQSVEGQVAIGTEEWSFRSMDKALVFGSLQAGTYTFRITAADSAGGSTEFARTFTVSSSSTVTDYFWTGVSDAA